MNDKKGDINMNGEEQAKRVAWLVAGFLRQILSEKEHDELDEWVTASDENQRLFEELTDTKNIEKGIAALKGIDSEKMLRRVKEKMTFHAPVRKSRKGRSVIYATAASVLLIVGMAVIYLILFKKEKKEITGTDQMRIQPGGNKATLTLTNGKTIDLEAARKGLIDSTAGVEVLKSTDGQLTYENANGENKGEHLLTTPIGGQYSVRLPDGTMVWLNSSSSLKYPVVFDKEKRVVELSGEGYFEVAPLPRPLSTSGEGGARTPFIVKLKNGAEVEVLGTHFNINAYDDEDFIAATLLEGRVMVRSRESALRHFDKLSAQGDKSQELVPGQQGQVNKNGEVKVINDVNTEEVIAWKNGMFKFKDQLIDEIMRQVGRWYGAEVVYEEKPDFHFNATILRNEPVKKLLSVLEETNRVHFRIEGKKIFVRK